MGNCSGPPPPPAAADGFRLEGDCGGGDLTPTGASERKGEARRLPTAAAPATAAAVTGPAVAEDRRRRGRGMGRRPLVAEAVAASAPGGDSGAVEEDGRGSADDDISPVPRPAVAVDVREGFATRGFGNGSEIRRG